MNKIKILHLSRCEYCYNATTFIDKKYINVVSRNKNHYIFSIRNNFDINNLEKNVYVQGNRWYYYNPSTKGLMSICAIYGYIYKHSIEVKINDNNIDVEIKDFKDLQIII